MLDIAIPLAGKSGWGDNNELRYLLRSLEKNLKIPFRVLLYTRALPQWINQREISCRVVPKYYPDSARKFNKVDQGGKKHYETYFDVLHKLEVMSRDENLSGTFLYCYDDILLVREIESLEEIDKRLALMHYDEGKSAYEMPVTKWGHTATRAFDLLKREDRPLWDYETHLPRVLRKQMLQSMFEKFPVEKEKIPYAPSTLYFNLFYDGPDDKIYGQNKVKAGFYGSRSDELNDYGDYQARDVEEIKKIVKTKTWVNYNNGGIGRHTVLKEWIQRAFPNKSKFEKK
jgi:hypothetical protein